MEEKASKNIVKCLFNDLNMKWKLVIIMAIIAGIYTGVAAMIFPDNSSFHMIAVTFESWIVLAIIIISNCKKPLEAAAKTFVFFLISQPLCYLVQVPFSSMGWTLFGYYRYWFIITLLTFPGAYIGWYIKKNNILSGIILSVMTTALTMQGIGFANDAIKNFPSHLFSAIFCFASVVVLIYAVFNNKKPKISAYAATCIGVVMFYIYYALNPTPSVHIQFPNYEYGIKITNECEAVSDNTEIGDVRVVELSEDNTILMIDFFKDGTFSFTLTDKDKNTYNFEATCNKEGQVEIIQK